MQYYMGEPVNNKYHQYNYINMLEDKIDNYNGANYLPLHIRPLGSGSHSPLSLQIAILDSPTSSSPGGQMNLIVFPSIGKPS